MAARRWQQMAADDIECLGSWENIGGMVRNPKKGIRLIPPAWLKRWHERLALQMASSAPENVPATFSATWQVGNP